PSEVNVLILCNSPRCWAALVPASGGSALYRWARIMKFNLILPLILIALASQELTAEAPKSIAQSSPEGLVSDLYKLDEKKQSPFSQTKDRGLVTKYFSERLAQLIWKDAVKSKGEVGALDADPHYDA